MLRLLALAVDIFLMKRYLDRAWIVLTPAGKKRGVASVVKELDAWHKKNLSKYKWLRGGIQIVDAVCPTSLFLRLFAFRF
jgi:hypothetical protein